MGLELSIIVIDVLFFILSSARVNMIVGVYNVKDCGARDGQIDNTKVAFHI